MPGSSITIPLDTNQYLCDGNGDRIAKGTLSSFSCNRSSNGFSPSATYVVGQDGGQLTELQSGTAVHTNIFAGGKLLATYAGSNTNFALSDWLGTKRAEVPQDGSCYETYSSLAYGDELTPNGNCPDATEHHYTTKEHDTESGNDFLFARYYSSNTGRFLSPDWAGGAEAVPYAKFDDPQSLNLYGYVRNNPLGGVDLDGHDTYDWLQGGSISIMTAIENATNIMSAGFVGDELVAAEGGGGAQQQSSSSSSNGGGFWSHVSNLFHGHSWNYGMRESVTVTIVPGSESEPNGYVTGATDAAGLAGLAAPEMVAKPLGRVGAAVSILNDPSPKNITTNVLGLLPGFDGPMAITGAFNDFLDWGINNGTGRVSPKAYGNDQLTPTLPAQDGGCLAAGLPSC